MCGMTLRDGWHGSFQVAVGACDTLQIQFLYRMDVLLCALQGVMLLSSPGGLRLCLHFRIFFVLAVESCMGQIFITCILLVGSYI